MQQPLDLIAGMGEGQGQLQGLDQMPEGRAVDGVLRDVAVGRQVEREARPDGRLEQGPDALGRNGLEVDRGGRGCKHGVAPERGVHCRRRKVSRQELAGKRLMPRAVRLGSPAAGQLPGSAGW